jgi:hypothetical protein
VEFGLQSGRKLAFVVQEEFVIYASDKHTEFSFFVSVYLSRTSESYEPF